MFNMGDEYDASCVQELHGGCAVHLGETKLQAHQLYDLKCEIVDHSWMIRYNTMIRSSTMIRYDVSCCAGGPRGGGAAHPGEASAGGDGPSRRVTEREDRGAPLHLQGQVGHQSAGHPECAR